MPVRDDHPFGHDTACSHQAAGADLGAIKDSPTHAYQGSTADGAGMNDSTVPKTDFICQDARQAAAEVHHAEVLNVAAIPENDAVDVSADHCPKPYRTIDAKRDVADQRRVGRQESGQLGMRTGDGQDERRHGRHGISVRGAWLIATVGAG